MENPARLALLKHFKWDKVALVVQNLDIYVMVWTQIWLIEFLDYTGVRKFLLYEQELEGYRQHKTNVQKSHKSLRFIHLLGNK